MTEPVEQELREKYPQFFRHMTQEGMKSMLCCWHRFGIPDTWAPLLAQIAELVPCHYYCSQVKTKFGRMVVYISPEDPDSPVGERMVLSRKISEICAKAGWDGDVPVILTE